MEEEALTREEWLQFVQLARSELAEKDSRARAAFSLTPPGVRYRWDLDEGLLVWSRFGQTIAVAEILLAGTLSNWEKTWLWSWANPVMPLRVRQGIDQLYDFGRMHSIEQLYKPEWPATNSDAQDMVSVACKVLGGHGGFRDETEHAVLWFVLMNINRPASQS